MLEGAFNFRDLGGLPTRDGRRLQAGKVFRSDTLQALTSADVRRLYGQMGLRGVVDLRLAEEVSGEGRGLLAEVPGVRYINLPLHMAATQGVAPDLVMRRLYLGSLGEDSPLPQAVGQLAEFSDHPVVFHCAAGKDRTGLLAALILRVLNVDDEVIVGDYMRSADAMPRMIERFATWPRYREHMKQTPAQAYEVDPASLLAFLSGLDAMDGGACGWLESRGVSRASIALLSRRWLL